MVRPAAFGALSQFVALLAVTILAISPAASRPGCQGEDGGTSLVAEIRDGETLILEDGRAVRLAGILGPRRARGGPASEARLQMEQALSALTMGKRVRLELTESKRDRYGRLLAQLKLAEGEEGAWVQERLVEDGLARVISFPDNRLCTAELLAAEERARQAPNGLWKTGFFAVRAATAEDVLFRLEQSYEIVEGEVANVAEIRGRIYINFGANWRRDFTIFISERHARQFASGSSGEENGAPVNSTAAWTGKRIRVRGWLKNFNGPSISVTHPEQIEILGQKSAAADQGQSLAGRGE